MFSYEIVYQNSSSYTHEFKHTYRNVSKLELMQLQLPHPPNVREGLNRLDFNYQGDKYGHVTLDEGVYSLTEVASHLSDLFNRYFASESVSAVNVSFEYNENTRRMLIVAYGLGANNFSILSGTSDIHRLLGLNGDADHPASADHNGGVRVANEESVLDYCMAVISLGDLPSRLPEFVVAIRPNEHISDGADINPVVLNPIGDISELNITLRTDNGPFHTMNQPHMMLLRITHEII